MHIYVGGLPAETTDEALRTMFAALGTVHSAVVVTDKKTGASLGYGFVEMPVKSEARKAVEEFRMKDLGAGPMRVRVLKSGDEFHASAVSKGNAAVHAGAKSTYRGEPGPVGAGAIRRSGKRGS